MIGLRLPQLYSAGCAIIYMIRFLFILITRVALSGSKIRECRKNELLLFTTDFLNSTAAVWLSHRPAAPPPKKRSMVKIQSTISEAPFTRQLKRVGIFSPVILSRMSYTAGNCLLQTCSHYRKYSWWFERGILLDAEGRRQRTIRQSISCAICTLVQSDITWTLYYAARRWKDLLMEKWLTFLPRTTAECWSMDSAPVCEV